MKEEFKKSVIDLMKVDEKQFDELYSSLGFRGIRINTDKTDFETVAKTLPFIAQKTDFYKDEYYIPSDFEGIGNLPLHHAGGFYVQEPSASSVLSVIDVVKGEKVLDLCAAPGGKSTGIGAQLKGTGILWSNEYVRKRAAILLSNIERMGISNCAVSSFDAQYLCSSLEGVFDAVLVDAPCSGEGMWRHNNMVEQQWSKENIDECVNRQREILSSAQRAVKSGGRLVYSTCTFNIKENEDNVAWFLKEFPSFRLKKISNEFGTGGRLGKEEIDKAVKRIFPTHGGEGHFIALFERENDGNSFEYKCVQENISAANKRLVEDFLKENFDSFPEGVLIEKNNLVHLVPKDMPYLKGDVLRYGLFVGEIRKNRLEPSHALFVSSKATPKNRLELSADDERIKAFLKGEEIKSQGGENGYVGIFVEGVALGFGKRSKDRITNKYPKGLRLL